MKTVAVLPVSQRAKEVLGVVTNEWQSTRTIAKASGVPRQSAPKLLAEWFVVGRVQRRGMGVIGDGYEWRLA